MSKSAVAKQGQAKQAGSLAPPVSVPTSIRRETQASMWFSNHAQVTAHSLFFLFDVLKHELRIQSQSGMEDMCLGGFSSSAGIARHTGCRRLCTSPISTGTMLQALHLATKVASHLWTELLCCPAATNLLVRGRAGREGRGGECC